MESDTLQLKALNCQLLQIIAEHQSILKLPSSNTVSELKTLESKMEAIKTKMEIIKDKMKHMDSNVPPGPVKDGVRKEQFLYGLGLVTKEQLVELQTRKSTRKRRTTANPHFSNAAIEAKRATQIQIAAKKALRRERTRVSLYSRRDSDTSNTTTNNKFKSLSGGTSGTATGGSNPLQSSSNLNRRSNNSNGGPGLTGTSDHQLKSAPKILSQDCISCTEQCEPEFDAIIFCSNCVVVFHATCASTVNEIVSNGGSVPCPKCKDIRLVETDQVSDFGIIQNKLNFQHQQQQQLQQQQQQQQQQQLLNNSNASYSHQTNSSSKHHSHHSSTRHLHQSSTNSKASNEPNVHIIASTSIHGGSNSKISSSNTENYGGRSIKSSKKPKNQEQANRSSNYVDKVTLNRENGMSQEVSLKSHYLEKRSELQVLMEQKSLLVAEWNERKSQYEGERNSYLETKEKSKKLKVEQEKIEEKINKLVGFIKQMKVWNNIIDDQDGNPSTTKSSVTTSVSSNQSVVVSSATAKLVNPNAAGRIIREIKPVPATSTLALTTTTSLTLAPILMEPKRIPISAASHALSTGQIAPTGANVTIIVPANPTTPFTNPTMLTASGGVVLPVQGLFLMSQDQTIIKNQPVNQNSLLRNPQTIATPVTVHPPAATASSTSTSTSTTSSHPSSRPSTPNVPAEKET